jgi:hypothetical protein
MVKSIVNPWPNDDGISWDYEVQWEYWDEKDNTWEPDAIWQKLKRQ